MAYAAGGVIAVLLLFAGLSALSSTYLNPKVVPSTPYVGQIADGQLQIQVFSRPTAQHLKEPSSYLMHGRLAQIQLESDRVTRNRLLGLFGLAAACGLMLVLSRHVVARLAFLASTAALSVFWSLRVSAGWDEYFINLKHAFNLAHHFTFSANVHSHLEATVDFIPFVVAALFSKIFAMDLADAGLVVSLSGNVISIVAGYLLARRLARGAELPAVIAAILVGTAPFIVYVGGTGFMSGLFAGLVLVSAYWCVALRGKWTIFGLTLLGLLTLFRTEAVLLSALVWAAFTGRFLLAALASRRTGRALRRAWRIIGVRALGAFAPFIVSVVVRLAIFHEAVPTPVIFKNANGNPFYLRGGINYVLDCLAAFRADVLFAIAGLFIVHHVLSLGSRVVLFLCSVLLFTMAYAAGGGDWFPTTWARYIAPLVLMTTVLTVTAIHAVSARAPKPYRLPAFAMLLAIVGLLLFGVGAGRNGYRDLLTDWRGSLNRWERVDRLAAYGDFLRQTTPDSAVVASPEDATLMYHAERDMIDLLGIANPVIARSKADPKEPGDLMHRRRNLDVLKTAQPEIVALLEMSYGLGADFNPQDAEAIRSFVQGNQFSLYNDDIAFYRIGSFAYLQSLGYRPVVVVQPGRLFFYWVHARALDDHIARLGRQGFAPLATVNAVYTYSQTVTDRFFGGLPFASSTWSFNGPLTAPPEKPAVVSVDPTIGVDAVPPGYLPPDPVGVGTVYATWSGGDANKGVIKLGPLKVRPGAQVLQIPLLQGPVGDHQLVTIRDASTGALLRAVTLHLATPHMWYWLSLDFNGSLRPDTRLTVELADLGDKWGEWSAIGTPRIATASLEPKTSEPQPAAAAK